LRDHGGEKLWGKKLRSEMDICYELMTRGNSHYRLTGPVNEASLHGMPVEPYEGEPEEMRYSITMRRVARLAANLQLGEYRAFNDKTWQTRGLPSKSSDATAPRANATPAERAPKRRKLDSERGIATTSAGGSSPCSSSFCLSALGEAEVPRALNTPCPKLCEATVVGAKLIDNRPRRLPVGEYVLRCGSDKDRRKTFTESGLETLLPMIGELDFPEVALGGGPFRAAAGES